MTRLHRLFDEQDQSPWLDDLSRPSLRDGWLAGAVARGTGTLAQKAHVDWRTNEAAV